MQAAAGNCISKQPASAFTNRKGQGVMGRTRVTGVAERAGLKASGGGEKCLDLSDTITAEGTLKRGLI